MPSTNYRYLSYMNYLGNKWLWIKHFGDTAAQLEYLDDHIEMEETFPLTQVRSRGGNLINELRPGSRQNPIVIE
ncbi:MAG: hypothetical protein [CRESS virus sp. ctf7a5]|uniref:Uncharacterized protein n=1 Tax=CRESS virus sp. ctf7a5 TaxID=2656684 RepID=A0A5Q2W404_9VIRU|nr:MAG: hypothetical protein [CRESS virus sp. ctf7a5]